jgi:hypothetical protein
MTDPAEVAHINERVDEAITGIGDLRRSVEGMTHATAELAAIKREQVELQAKADAAEQLAVKTKAENDLRAKRVRKGMRRLTLGVVAAIALLVFAVGTVAVLVANDAAEEARELIDEANQNRYPSCIQRNAAVQVQIQRERVLAALPDSTEVESHAHSESADALEKLLVDCEQYQKTSS